MPRETQEQAAKRLGITRNILQNAKAAGVNWRDDAAMKEWIGTRRPKIKGDAQIETPEDPENITIEDLEFQVKAAKDYDSVKILKEKIASLLQAQKVRKEAGDLISRKAVDERDTRIAAAVKGALLKFCNDCPPMIEGLTAAKAQKVIKSQMVGILEQLANDQSEFWTQASG